VTNHTAYSLSPEHKENTMTTWHRGTAQEIIPGSTVEQQLQSAGLDWEVKLSPVFYGPEREHEAPVFAAYRGDNNVFFDIYTTRKPWQNAEIVETFNRFCDDADLPMTHLGSLDGGRMLYAAAKLPEMIAPAQAVGDLTEGYLLLEDSHLNGKGLSVSLYANRLICTNGMKIPVRTGQRIIAHVGRFNPGRIETILEAARATLHQEKEQMTGLAAVGIDKAEATMQLIAAFGEPGKPVEEQPRIVQTCLKLFNGMGKGSSELSAYNTAYGLLHSVTEYYNHHAVKRGTMAQQFQSILSGNRAKQMQKFERQVVSCYLS
jgi:phage/plasmid-like protein (TIGR03299 family)